MRILIVIPIVVALAAVVGFAICRAIGVDPHVKQMLLASGACVLASELSIVPILLTRGALQEAVAQAGLVGTIIHLFGCLVLGGGMLLVRSIATGAPLIYWLLAMYWLTLVVVVTGLVRGVKAAPITGG